MAMIGIADQIRAINESQMAAGKMRVEETFMRYRRWSAVTIGLTIGLGLLLAAFSMRKILALEAQTARNFSEISRARAELQQLSARLVEAQENERRSISRELHDEVGQALTGVLVEMANLSTLIRTAEREEVAAKAVEIKRLMEASIIVVRNMALLLRPSMLDDLGLAPALQWQAREVSKRTGITVKVTADEIPEELPEDHKTCIYRVVQEALHNVVQHAGARNIRVTVRQEGERLLLSDRGRRQGLRPADRKGHGPAGHGRAGEPPGRQLRGGVRARPRSHLASGVARARREESAGGFVKTIRILLADDHTVVRKGLRLLLETQPGFTVVADAADGREAVALAEKLSPDVVVMDVAMPILNGIEAARQISAKLPQTAVVFLSMHADEGYVLKALKAGARAYLLKDSAEYDLINAIKAVTEGKAFFSPAISKMLVEDYMRQMRERAVEDSYDLLTTREREVLQLLAEGKSNKEAAQLLGLSLYTVETHRSNILQKLNLHSSAELILYAVRKGVIG